ncbi:MAG: helix-turn-helix domain-containing protein [Chloroflexota bacterium]
MTDDGETPFQPQDRFDVGDLETLRVLADPLRLRILEAFVREGDAPQTVKQVARVLGESPTKLYYHVQLLEERGLIRMTATRVVSGIIEKRYQPVARSYRVDRTLLDSTSSSGATEAIASAVASLLEGAREDILDGMRDGRILAGDDVPVERRAIISRTGGRMAPERARAFLGRLEALCAELDEADDSPDAVEFGLTLAFYPARPRQSEETDA